jgi:Tetrahydromethanopterin S-methyltransferase, subunit A
VAFGDVLAGQGTGGAVAVCCLTSRELVAPLRSRPEVAIAGCLMTANLGIEEIVRTLLRRPRIRGLLVCGKDSPRFRSGQSLLALFRAGLDDDRRIIGADGYVPMLRSLTTREVEEVRDRVQVVDAVGERDLAVLGEQLAALLRRLAGAAPGEGRAGRQPAEEAMPDGVDPRTSDGGFTRLVPVGRRNRIHSALDGFIVIDIDRGARRIRLRHYGSDLSRQHEVYGHRAESILLGVLEAGLITELSHAGYLGAELAKAESALRLGLDYEQDLPLRGNQRHGAADGDLRPDNCCGDPTSEAEIA